MPLGSRLAASVLERCLGVDPACTSASIIGLRGVEVYFYVLDTVFRLFLQSSSNMDQFASTE